MLHVRLMGIMLMLLCATGVAVISQGFTEKAERRENALTAQQCEEAKGRLEVVGKFLENETVCLMPDGTQRMLRTPS